MTDAVAMRDDERRYRPSAFAMGLTETLVAGVTGAPRSTPVCDMCAQPTSVSAVITAAPPTIPETIHRARIRLPPTDYLFEFVNNRSGCSLRQYKRKGLCQRESVTRALRYRPRGE